MSKLTLQNYAIKTNPPRLFTLAEADCLIIRHLGVKDLDTLVVCNCLVCCCSTATDRTERTGHVVQGETLVAADSCVLVVVLPRREDEQLPSGTGLHALPARFGQVGEAVLLQMDKGEALLKGGTHHSLLARRN